MSRQDEIEQNPDEQQVFYEEEEEEANFNEEEAPFEVEEDSKPSFTVSMSQVIEEGSVLMSKLRSDVTFCRAHFEHNDFEFEDPYLDSIKFRIPTTILPLSVSVVNGFYQSPYLLECKFEFAKQNPYRTRPNIYSFVNPTYEGETFPGSVLMKNRFRNFFSDNYKPSTNYRCQNYVLAPQVTVDQDKINSTIDMLVNEGFPLKKAKRALLFCSYDIEKARDFLISGLLPQANFPIPVKYADCPLFYLILELCEAFFDMGDCCCVCGKKLGVYHLKPACCDEKNCQYAFMCLGVGSNIIGEIKRDPLATDLIIALAGAAYAAPPSPPVFDPSPESQGLKLNMKFFQRLPSMQALCNKCNTDRDLKELIGDNYYEILRFFILANKAQFITLPDKVKTSLDINCPQFLVTSVSPESELVFRDKRKDFGVKWLWHGSHADRWYRIMHTGLKDLGRTDYQLHGGPWFGDGIYMSDSFRVSLGYCIARENIYKNSKLPPYLLVISLVENAAVPELTGPVAPNEYTQRDDSACITRVLLVVPTNNSTSNHNQFNSPGFNVLHTPPKVPTLHEVLSYQMQKFI